MLQYVKYTAVKPGGHFMTVQQLGSGWADVKDIPMLTEAA